MLSISMRIEPQRTHRHEVASRRVERKEREKRERSPFEVTICRRSLLKF
ncbi:hypothetical protein [uncultured Nostoc sp.]|nr:hypothetical protein [uncultured Nostoc sp.]